MSYKFLKLKFEEEVCTVTIDKAKSLNALNSDLLEELDDCFTELENNDDLKVVIITGVGKSFIAGGDISEMSNLNSEQSGHFAKRGMDVCMKIERLNKPVIAAINGYALGGGCELSLSCDIRIASNKAKFGQPEVSLGITPGFGGSQRLPRAIGVSKAKELIYTGDIIDAEEALRVGIVSYVVEPEKLMEKAMEIASKISKNSKLAVRYAKDAINNGLQTDIETAMNIEKSNFALCFSTEDQKEGMTAFLEKRSPDFKGN
ncbi:MAG: enoyl-CoA hydratase-related protein [Peptoniphilaceae bacterium]